MPTTIQPKQTNGTKPAYTPPSPPPRRPRDSDNSGYWAAFSLLLGMLVVVIGAVAIWMGFSAHDARNDAKKAVSTAASMPGMDMSGMDMSGTGGSVLKSYAGQAPANADALAKAHVPMNAALPPIPAGPTAHVKRRRMDEREWVIGGFLRRERRRCMSLTRTSSSRPLTPR